MYNLSFNLLLLVALAYGHNYYQTCSENHECHENLICFNDTCRCPVQHQYDQKTLTCKTFYEMTCQSDVDCQDVDFKQHCNSAKKCECYDGFYTDWHDKFCYPQKGHGEECRSSGSSTSIADPDYLCLGNMHCKRPEQYSRSGRCVCHFLQQWSEELKTCVNFDKSTCTNDIECQDWDPGMRCLNINGVSKCQCNVDQWMNSTGFCSSGVDRNERCSHDIDCKHNLSCHSRVCRCPLGHQWSALSKSCIPFDMATCNKDEECQDWDPARRCFTTDDKHGIARCKCDVGYRLNSTKFCTTGGGGNDYCRVDLDCRENMTCNRKCSCKDGNEWSEWQKKCLLFDETECDSDKDCQEHDPLLKCDDPLKVPMVGIKNKCVCKNGYLFGHDGKCLSILASKDCKLFHDCSPLNSACKQNKTRNYCTCHQTHVWSESDCQRRSCASSSDCISDEYENNHRMECKSGSCWCSEGMNYTTGECRPLKYYFTGAFWISFLFFLIFILIFGALLTLFVASFIIVFRIVRTKMSGSTLFGGQVIQPNVETTAKTVEESKVNQIPGFIFTDQPLKCPEKQSQC